MEIDINKELRRFGEFLEEENNNNIVFSGIFGIGKSYFMNKFFNEYNNNKYISLFLCSAKYSVASNEDIFEYIKADILLQLLSKSQCDFDTLKLNLTDYAYLYLSSNIDKFIGNLLEIAGEVCQFSKVATGIIKLRESLKRSVAKQSINDEKEVLEFFKSIQFKKGSIYEEDLITQIIHYLVRDEKAKSNKKAVLIIDDLDRIDQEHIFRILNILSVHNDYYSNNENKFGIDKTILVCDINNIRHIYENKYGVNVDFNGYIDKFYSKRIFYFDNGSQIISKLTYIVSGINCDSEIIKNRAFWTHRVLIYILSALVQTGNLNMRDIVRLQSEFVIDKRVRYKYKRDELNVSEIPAFLIIEFLRQIFDSKNGLDNAISVLSNKYSTIRAYNSNFAEDEFLGVFIALADFPHNGFKTYDEFKYQNITYSLDRESYIGIATIKTPLSQIGDINLFAIMQEAYKNYMTYFYEIK